MNISSKILMTILVIISFTTGISSFAQKAEGGVPVFTAELNQEAEIPDSLEIGEMAIVSLLSRVSNISIECDANSAAQPFVANMDVHDLDGISEMARLIQKIQIRLKISNPQDLISLRAKLEDENGEELFNSYQGFNLEKVYDKDGNISWMVPDWAGNLYFQPKDIVFDFPGVKSAKVKDNNGEEMSLFVNSGKVSVPGWYLTGANRYDVLVITTFSGREYFYDLHTGEMIDTSLIFISPEEVSVVGIRQVPLEDNSLVIQVQPEYNFNPWIETNSSPEGMMLDVESYWGIEPIAVHVITLDELRDGEAPEPYQYRRGMILETTGTVYLWFEFPSWLNGAGGPGKG